MPYTFDIRAVFMKARQMSPCLVILEDIDTVIGAMNRSYFFNEVDGLEDNDGILMIATTNHRTPFPLSFLPLPGPSDSNSHPSPSNLTQRTY